MRLHDLVSGLIILSGAALLGTTVAAQSTKSLTLEDAERIAIQNHPQIQVAWEHRRSSCSGREQILHSDECGLRLTGRGLFFTRWISVSNPCLYCTKCLPPRASVTSPQAPYIRSLTSFQWFKVVPQVFPGTDHG